MNFKNPRTVAVLLLLAAVGIYAYVYFRKTEIENIIGAVFFIALFSVTALICEIAKKK